MQLSASLRIIDLDAGSATGGNTAFGGGGGAGALDAVITDPAGAEIFQQQLLPDRANLTAPVAGVGRYTLW